MVARSSADDRAPAGTRRGNKWLCAMLVEAAGSVGRMKSKNYLAAQHARLTQPFEQLRRELARHEHDGQHGQETDGVDG